MSDELTNEQKTVWDVVRAINDAWFGGIVDNMAEHMHDRMVITSPGRSRLGLGRDACVQSYRDFIEAAHVLSYVEDEPLVDVYETTAVVTYGYHIGYELGGYRYEDKGYDTFVLQREGERWLAVWRTVQTVDEEGVDEKE